ncbi:hypothetical protein H6F42_13570 [Pseudanabaena sp. FACHB-1998]|nr:hypothetical protein [Pseudanabaena sp. FACHB-1998]MBD2177944.1 hypothetical protein [Pseudanabaena sp. FACHB-1998]
MLRSPHFSVNSENNLATLFQSRSPLLRSPPFSVNSENSPDCHSDRSLDV